MDYIKDAPFWLYAMESEGDIPTKQGKMNKFLKILADSPNPNGELEQKLALSLAGLSPSDLEPHEIAYLEEQINKMIQ